MLLRSVKDTGFLALGILAAFSHVVDAYYNIEHQLKPQGELGVALDYSLATSWPEEQDKKDNRARRNWFFSSHLKFKESVDQIEDGVLWQIARDAIDEMTAEAEQYGITRRNIPGAMAILAWGNEIILASSQRPISFSYGYHGTEVLESLKLCQMVWHEMTGDDQEHRRQGMCAEPMAVHLYYSMTETPLQNQRARIGAWTPIRSGGWKQSDPCGFADEWGCALFIADQNLQVIKDDITPKEYDLKELAGGVSIRDQIQLCSVARAHG
ncbi:hypothetical protein AJ79_00818 [Helicocarpus griseus UAMH5409]|uniref:Uncharacterized protein n=1 Tax=Helicocarpus griseus UAMH5409 TaxID=1447875 RepID=A0A2B7Y9Z7_9EURO|nr:hypothetical protein AJ79_00818 [Helicocarpus griseus UAMH5409]